jgi:HSP20 family protein
MALVKFQRRPARIAFPDFGGAVLPGFEEAENRMNRFIDRVFNEPFATLALPETFGWLPAMDVAENAKELTLSAELPGMDQKDVDVSVEDGVLTIKGEKLEERKEDEDKKSYLVERSYGTFHRSFALPPIVNGDKVTAEFDKGVLKVHLPKDAEAKPKGRKVEIKTG